MLRTDTFFCLKYVYLVWKPNLIKHKHKTLLGKLLLYYLSLFLGCSGTLQPPISQSCYWFYCLLSSVIFVETVSSCGFVFMQFSVDQNMGFWKLFVCYLSVCFYLCLFYIQRSTYSPCDILLWKQLQNASKVNLTRDTCIALLVF